MHAFRFLPFGFVGGLLLSVAASCGPTVPEKSCSPGSCDGCCAESGDCLSGTSVFECGTGGTACVTCAANETCQSGACGRFPDGDYDASFPDKPDAAVNYDAGVFRPPDAGVADAGTSDAGPANVSYSATIQPLLGAKCVTCHGAFSSYGNIVNSNNRIIPGNLNASNIYVRTLSGDMPRGGGAALTSTQQGQLRDWILNGAPNN